MGGIGKFTMMLSLRFQACINRVLFGSEVSEVNSFPVNRDVTAPLPVSFVPMNARVTRLARPISAAITSILRSSAMANVVSSVIEGVVVLVVNESIRYCQYLSTHLDWIVILVVPDCVERSCTRIPSCAPTPFAQKSVIGIVHDGELTSGKWNKSSSRCGSWNWLRVLLFKEELLPALATTNGFNSFWVPARTGVSFTWPSRFSKHSDSQSLCITNVGGM